MLILHLIKLQVLVSKAHLFTDSFHGSAMVQTVDKLLLDSQRWESACMCVHMHTQVPVTAKQAEGLSLWWHSCWASHLSESNEETSTAN